jgi:hypothetical protein
MLRNPEPHRKSDDAAPQLPPPSCDCDTDPVEGLKKLTLFAQTPSITVNPGAPTHFVHRAISTTVQSG